jgi:outer membrane protein insertion porin family
VLLDTNKVIQSTSTIQQYMENLGYFYAKVNYAIKPIKTQHAIVTYYVDAGKNYTIHEIHYTAESPSLQELLDKNQKESILQSGDPYTKINCGLERERLYRLIKNAGFFDFKSDNIGFVIDTVNKQRIKNLLLDPFEQAVNYSTKEENKTIDVQVQIAMSKDSSYQQLYRIKNVRVNIQTPQNETEKNARYIENTLDDIHFSYKVLPVNRRVITRNIFIHPGDVYSTNNFEITMNRLNQLGIFQFVNIQYEKIENEPGQLNCIITLNSSPKMDIVYFTEVSTGDDDYTLGTGLGLTFRNKNLAHGANLLSIRTSYSTEFRNDKFLTGEKKFYQSGNNVNLGTTITFPKFIVPFNQNVFNKKNMPYTTIGATYSFVRRLQNYTLINFTGNFGYSWLETSQKSWRFNPAFLTITRVPEKYLSDDFKKKRETNTYLRNTFSDNIIYGENVLFEYRSKLKNNIGNFSSLKVGFEEAGSILTGINSLSTKLGNTSLQSIAHYVKSDFDFRMYKSRRKSQWANRIMIGIGVPIGLSSSLPYIKQYTAGGPFSNRGWQARNLGPGRSIDSSFLSGFTIIDRTGDIKFEANSEYRFNLLKLFSGAINIKGAFFVDAGNIWLMNKNDDVAGGEFDVNYLWQDIAIGAGSGLRLDFSFFVFRVDLGYPIKQPNLTKNSGFAFNQLKYKSGVWNIGLGYPF